MLKELKENTKMNMLKLGIACTEAMVFCNAVILQAYADSKDNAEAATGAAAVEQKVEKSSTSIYGLIKGVCLSLIVIVLAVCGLILIVGTQKMKDAVKEHFYSIAIGVMVLFFASEITNYIEETFG